MKKVVTGEELRCQMEEAINLLCDTVKMTLGPKGVNSIIANSNFSPFITNDGVTIASNIESEDVVVNTILEIAKEASLKTNDLVGDGTTTTLVILQSIFNKGLELLRKKVNPIILKKELDQSLPKFLALIDKKAYKPSAKELECIATIASNDEKIGKIISEAYLKVSKKEAITIKEIDSPEIKINYLQGYTFESMLPSLYFLEGLKTKEYINPYILIFNNYLDDTESIAAIINFIIQKKECLIIMANDYSEEFVNTILSLNLEYKVQIMLLKIPEYGLRKLRILEDLEAITKSHITDNLENIHIDSLGQIEKASINEEFVTFSFQVNELVKLRIKKLKEDLLNTETEREFIQKRLAMFENGMTEILVGARTTTERREIRMRLEDGLWAISSADAGVVAGMGLTLTQISEEFAKDLPNKKETLGDKILKDAIKMPMYQIITNAGLVYEDIFHHIAENNYQELYNINKNTYEKLEETSVLDSKEVVKNSLASAVSIAGMLLTTTSLVINEYQNNFAKGNDYNEM